MMDPVVQLQIDEHICSAIKEDTPFGDISTQAVAPKARRARVHLIAKAAGTLAGLAVFSRVFELLDATTSVDASVADGDQVHAGQQLATIEADVRALLEGERTALNYLQRMSGIATYTHAMVAALAGSDTTLVCTRKTTPGMRLFEREAVRLGGGSLHRFGLSDGVLLKDNHIDAAGGVAQAIKAAHINTPFVRKIEVECETLAMVHEALEAGADIIMLDNMDHDTMAKAVAEIDGRAETEASGNVELSNIAQYADVGVDFVSCGALTHSAPILDLSLKHLTVVA